MLFLVSFNTLWTPINDRNVLNANYTLLIDLSTLQIDSKYFFVFDLIELIIKQNIYNLIMLATSSKKSPIVGYMGFIPNNESH
jgi:hypothetical protein